MNNLYEIDFNKWVLEQTQLLENKQLSELDLDNLIEEIKSMGNSDKTALESNLRVLLMHLLKWAYQPEKRSNSWKSSIVEHCLRLHKAFKKSPTLKNYFDEIFEETYQDAKSWASAETGINKKNFPNECPFDKEYVLSSNVIFVEMQQECC